MYNHAPPNYVCPICLGVEGIENGQTLLRKEDLIFRNELVSVFINSFFIRGNEGHVIIVPNAHIENIYDLTSECATAIMDAAKKMAVVIKEAYQCDGITLRQNNEPAGDQHAFHFHMHVIPRYENDRFNTEMAVNKIETTLDERRPFNEKLKKLIKLSNT